VSSKARGGCAVGQWLVLTCHLDRMPRAEERFDRIRRHVTLA
jgi:hypothetical protein